jgi:hypothetical protein
MAWSAVGRVKSANIILSGTSKGKRHTVDLKADNDKIKTHLLETEWRIVNWIQLAEDRVRCRTQMAQ